MWNIFISQFDFVYFLHWNRSVKFWDWFSIFIHSAHRSTVGNCNFAWVFQMPIHPSITYIWNGTFTFHHQFEKHSKHEFKNVAQFKAHRVHHKCIDILENGDTYEQGYGLILLPKHNRQFIQLLEDEIIYMQYPTTTNKTPRIMIEMKCHGPTPFGCCQWKRRTKCRST